MTLVLIAELRTHPGEAGSVLAILDALVEPSMSEPGCLGYRPLLDPAASDVVVCLEEWVNEDALQFHFATAHFVDAAERLDAHLREPFVLRRLADVEESGGHRKSHATR